MADAKPPKDTSAQQPIDPVSRKSMESGLITKGAVSENTRPETSVEESINFHFDTIGAATVRPGITLLGASLGSAILGMHYFVDTLHGGTNTQMMAVAGTSLSYLASGTWTSKRTGLTAGSKARFVTYLDFTFMVNGTEATAVWTGAPADSFITSGNALNAPTGTVIENFRSRIWIAGNSTYPDRLYYSSIPTLVTTPVVVWDTDVATGQWIDISPSDGDQITALQRYRNQMIVFKTNRLYRVFDIGQIDPDPYYAVGTYSQESVVETKAGVFFHHSTGIYQYNVYGAVQEISRPIIDIIKAVPTSAYASVTGWLAPDGDHICWMLGTVTVNGVTYANLTIRYSISTMVWTHYQYPYQFVASLRRQPLYNDGTKQYALVGDTSGNIFETDNGLSDNGLPIMYSIIHRWETLDGLLSTRKIGQTINFSHYGGGGTTAAYQTDKNDPDDLKNWTQKLGLKGFGLSNTGYNSADIKGRKFRLRIFGQSDGTPFFYNGYELLDWLNEFLQFDKVK